jgi:hypothetical protein
MNSYTESIEKRKSSGQNPRIRSALGGMSSKKNEVHQPDKSFFQNGLSNALAAHERGMKSR